MTKEEIEAKFEKIDLWLKQVEKTFKSMNKRLDELEGRLMEVADKQSRIRSEETHSEFIREIQLDTKALSEGLCG